MKTFNDNAGRTWTLAINVDAIKRVRDLVKVNLLEIADGKLVDRLVSDPILLCDVIYALCKPEADQRTISDSQFGAAMAGDAIDQATTALLEEVVGFFPQARRKVLAKAMAKLKTLQQTVLDRAEAKIDSPELERELQKLLNGSSGSALESPESTPAG